MCAFFADPSPPPFPYAMLDYSSERPFLTNNSAYREGGEGGGEGGGGGGGGGIGEKMIDVGWSLLGVKAEG